MNTLKLIVGLAAAGIAGGVGTYWVMHAQQQAREAAAAAQATTSTASFRTENERLKNEIIRLQAAAAAMPAPSPLTALRALVAAEQQKLIQPLSTLLRMNKGQLQPAVVELFNLTVDEKAALENDLIAVRAELDALSAANVASVDRVSANSVVIRFKLFPEAGGKVYDRFLEMLEKTLGSERERALMVLMGDRFELLTGNGFGAAERSVTFERRQQGTADRPRTTYSVIDRTMVPGHSPAVQNSDVTVATSHAYLEDNFSVFIKLLPGDF